MCRSLCERWCSDLQVSVRETVDFHRKDNEKNLYYKYPHHYYFVKIQLQYTYIDVSNSMITADFHSGSGIYNKLSAIDFVQIL